MGFPYLPPSSGQRPERNDTSWHKPSTHVLVGVPPGFPKGVLCAKTLLTGVTTGEGRSWPSPSLDEATESSGSGKVGTDS